MAKEIQAIRGMSDILPQQIGLWQKLEQVVRELCASYGYSEIRTPIVESTDLFKRSIGEVTDIVEKEMYTFDDRNGDSLTLRPEGTASTVRAGNQHGLLYNQEQRLWYTGPMFRHERPQKGRYRQFHQFGVEVYGIASADADAEILLMSARLWKKLGLTKQVRLELNTLGDASERLSYRDALVTFLEQHKEKLDNDSLRRLTSNPLRILDSKNSQVQSLLKEAPILSQYLGEESKEHFAKVCAILDTAGIDYDVNPRLVRGLDYYNQTVFEWVTDALGAQGTVLAGGRYNGLVEQLGGKSTPAVGFAAGLERLVLLLESTTFSASCDASVDLYMVAMGESALHASIILSEELREQFPQLKIMMHCGGGNMKKQMKRADKSHAKFALILGDDELENQTVVMKPLREQLPQEVVERDKLIEFLQKNLVDKIK